MEKEKKKLSLKTIGPSRLVIMLLAGIFLVVLSFPGMFSSSDKTSKKAVSKDESTLIKSSVNSIEAGDETDTYLKLMAMVQ
jgi:stage III sporulation protein AG